MQGHVATLKADVHQLKRKMTTVIDKVKVLQNEFGIVEDWNEGELETQSVMSGTGAYYGMSRPSSTEMDNNHK